MARILCISKYPPLEGGISARTYWLTRALAERGHEIHVVTDRVDVSPEYAQPAEEECPIPPGVVVHRPDSFIPWHIPNDSHRSVDLLNTAVDVISRFSIDVIDSGYLIPYGIVGYLASQTSGIPFVLRHGGSDIVKFLNNGVWTALVGRAFGTAAMTITDADNMNRIRQVTTRAVSLPSYLPDPAAFHQTNRHRRPKPVLALIGKANYYWRHKGWDRAVDIMEALGLGLDYKIVSQGVGLADFQGYAKERLGDHVQWNSFVHPVRMADILRSVDAVFSFHQNLPFPAFSNIAAEALYCGTTVITDRIESEANMRQNGIETADLPGTFLTLCDGTPMEAAEKINKHFLDRKAKRGRALPDAGNYRDYVAENERVVLSVANQ